MHVDFYDWEKNIAVFGYTTYSNYPHVNDTWDYQYVRPTFTFSGGTRVLNRDTVSMNYMSLPVWSAYAIGPAKNSGSFHDTAYYSMVVKVSDPTDLLKLNSL
jgi:hypothetical protein